MPDPENNSAETAEDKNGLAGTAGETKPDQAIGEPDEDGRQADLASQVDKWRSLSRETEKKMHANKKRADEAETKLADIEGRLADKDLQIARLTTRLAHPSIPQEVFDRFCKETSADAIEQWATDFEEEILKKMATSETEGRSEAKKQAPNPAGYLRDSHAPQVQPPAKGTAQSGYEYGLKHATVGGK